MLAYGSSRASVPAAPRQLGQWMWLPPLTSIVAPVT